MYFWKEIVFLRMFFYYAQALNVSIRNCKPSFVRGVSICDYHIMYIFVAFYIRELFLYLMFCVRYMYKTYLPSLIFSKKLCLRK